MSFKLMLYKYYLEFDFKGFHVDSWHNLFYCMFTSIASYLYLYLFLVKSDWHSQFDANHWILLPSFAVLEEVHNFIQAVVSVQGRSAQDEIPSFFTNVNSSIAISSFLNMHTPVVFGEENPYMFIPLPSIENDPVTRQSVTLSPDTSHPDPVSHWDLHYHPYHTLPDLECHLAPPYVLAINRGPKLANLDLDAVTLDYCESSNSCATLKCQMELLCEIWEILLNAKDDANKWEESKRGKRKRDSEDEDIERLTQSTKWTMHLAAGASQDPAHNNTKNQRMFGHTSGARK